MDVLAFSSPRRPDWRWRIVNYAGETVEESSVSFSTIAQALANGAERLKEHIDRDLSAVARVAGRLSWPKRK